MVNHITFGEEIFFLKNYAFEVTETTYPPQKLHSWPGMTERKWQQFLPLMQWLIQLPKVSVQWQRLCTKHYFAYVWLNWPGHFSKYLHLKKLLKQVPLKKLQRKSLFKQVPLKTYICNNFQGPPIIIFSKALCLQNF